MHGHESRKWEKMMAAQRKTAVAVSSSVLIAYALLTGGCGTVFDNKPAACARALNHIERCLMAATGMGLGTPVSQLCAGDVPQSAAEVSAAANCVTSLSCEQLSRTEQSILSSTTECVAAIELLGSAQAFLDLFDLDEL